MPCGRSRRRDSRSRWRPSRGASSDSPPVRERSADAGRSPDSEGVTSGGYRDRAARGWGRDNRTGAREPESGRSCKRDIARGCCEKPWHRRVGLRVGSPGEPWRPRADRGCRSGRPATCGQPASVRAGCGRRDRRRSHSGPQRPGCRPRRQLDGFVLGRGRLRHVDADRGYACPAARPAPTRRPRSGRPGCGHGRDRCGVWWLGRGRANWDRVISPSMPFCWPRVRRRSCFRCWRNESSTAQRRWS
jgi:hypothetical protein